MLDIITISDFQAKQEDKVQVYISGALHGDEVIGPNIAYYLIEYLLSNFKIDSQITQLLKNREIVITPMTNAVGYYHYEREERINKDHDEFKNNPHKKHINRPNS
jgi:predicted deacylase